LLTIHSSLAREESRNLSENTRWGVVRRFEKGIVTVNHNKFMGYTKDKTGQLIIVPEEAEAVRKIFRLYLEGKSVIQIAKALEREKIKTATGNDKWHDAVIYKMLQNEKYMGDALLQKTYTVDFLTKKRVKNQGIVPQYYIEDNHEAIIPKELFYRVQEERARRASMNKTAVSKKKNKEKSKYSSKYALTDLMICSECGQPYRRQTWSKYGQKSGVWRCENRLKNGTKNCKHSPTLKEEPLYEAIMDAINGVVENQGEFVGAFRENVIRVIGGYSTKDVLTEFDGQYQKITEQIRELKEKKLKLVQEQKLAHDFKQRVDEMDDCLRKTTCAVGSFDEELVRRLLQSVKVINGDKLEIQFKSGIVMEQRVEYYE